MTDTPAPVNWMACLTPPGVAAIASLALYGPDTWRVARALFRPHGKTVLPDFPDAGRWWYGQLGEPGGLADQVILAVRSTRPQPYLEIHGHGGVEIPRYLQELLGQRGLSACSWQTLLAAAGEPPWKVKTREAVAYAPTFRTAAILLDQYHGAWEKAQDQILRQLRQGQTEPAASLVAELANRVPLGRHLLEPWRVVIAGAPNVGKSSLVNALAGYARSIVSPIPGATRDVVTAQIALDGWPVELTDTAGMRPEGGPLERLGMERAQEALSQADLRWWVLDGSQPPEWPEDPSIPWRYVINKVDLPPGWDWTIRCDAIQTSAATGHGVAELGLATADWLIPHPPPPGSAVPWTREQANWLENLSSDLGSR